MGVAHPARGLLRDPETGPRGTGRAPAPLEPPAPSRVSEAFQLYLFAVVISLDTFAASLALGTRTRPAGWLRIATVFAISGGLFPVLGLTLGLLAAGFLAQVAQWLGVLVLAGLGLWFVFAAWRDPDHPPGHLPFALQPAGIPPHEGEGTSRSDRLPLASLVLLAVGLSSDNLLVGLGLGLHGGATFLLGLLTAGSVFGATLTGLWLGRLNVVWFGRGAEAVSGFLLIGLATWFAFGL